MVKRIIVAMLVVLAVGLAVAQASRPALGNAVAGATTITGKADPGSAPITIYDISTDVKTKIGVAGTLATDGSFSSPVRPALIAGHQIVAIDNNGNASVPVTVAAAAQ